MTLPIVSSQRECGHCGETGANIFLPTGREGTYSLCPNCGLWSVFDPFTQCWLRTTYVPKRLKGKTR